MKSDPRNDPATMPAWENIPGDNQRRRLIGKLTLASSLIVADQWTRPVVKTAVLPATAATSLFLDSGTFCGVGDLPTIASCS